jgi:hypothetical protein
MGGVGAVYGFAISTDWVWLEKTLRSKKVLGPTVRKRQSAGLNLNQRFGAILCRAHLVVCFFNLGVFS